MGFLSGFRGLGVRLQISGGRVETTSTRNAARKESYGGGASGNAAVGGT